MTYPEKPRSRFQTLLDWIIIIGIAVPVVMILWYLVSSVSKMASPNEPYADSIGLTLDQCVASNRNTLSDDEARAYCRRSVPKRF